MQELHNCTLQFFRYLYSSANEKCRNSKNCTLQFFNVKSAGIRMMYSAVGKVDISTARAVLQKITAQNCQCGQLACRAVSAVAQVLSVLGLEKYGAYIWVFTSCALPILDMLPINITLTKSNFID